MGDTGSLALGGVFAALAVNFTTRTSLRNHWWNFCGRNTMLHVTNLLGETV